MSALFDLKFLTVVGKGGVGKTTVSAALAVAAARQGKRVLVAMCNTRERLSHLLEVEPIGPHNVEVASGIEAVNMHPQAALEEYGMMVLKVRALYRVIFENRFVNAFLRGTPGVEAWAMLGKAQYHAKETKPDGNRRYDLVILDAPATGHGLDMLRVPRVIMEIAPPGLLRREAEQAWEMFTDPQRAGVCLVTLPEDMPTNETLELYATMRDELKLPVSRLIVNRTLQRLFEPHQREHVARLHDALREGDALEPLARVGDARAQREAVQDESVQRLAEHVPVQRDSLPYLFVEDLRLQAIEQLAEHILSDWR